jgi:hypothetical protein
LSLFWRIYLALTSMPVHEMLGWPGVGESAHRRALSENDISDGSRWVVMLLGATSLSVMLVFCTRGCIAARMLDCCKKPYCSWNVNVNNAKELAVSRWKVADEDEDGASSEDEVPDAVANP